jgi:DNA-binding CsgD family transcriptional regulator
MGRAARTRALAEIGALPSAGLDLVSVWDRASGLIAPVVAHHMGPCWFTLDPATLLITSHVNPHVPELPHEALAMEYYEDDVHDLASVARSASGASTLHAAAGGDPRSSPRWRANMELGADQELIVALRGADGVTWGALSLYREPGQAPFSPEDIAFLCALAPPLAEAARRALLIGAARDPEGPDGPGLVVLGPGWEAESMSPGAERLLADLPGCDLEAGRLPPALLSVAGRALRSAEGRGNDDEVATARVRARSGLWMVLHGATLGADASRRVAVIVEPAHPARIGPLLMAAHGLTPREQEVTRLVLRGESTAAIARALVLSEHTVQQHMKGIFEKTGVRSRRELVGRVFFTHYEPRLRDNEARWRVGLPARGGPLAGPVPAPGPREVRPGR